MGVSGPGSVRGESPGGEGLRTKRPGRWMGHVGLSSLRTQWERKTVRQLPKPARAGDASNKESER